MINLTPGAGGLGRVIQEMFAWVLVHDDGNEAVPAGSLDLPVGIVLMPLMGADMERMESLRELAGRMAREAGKPIKLVRFSVREELETVHP